MSILPSRIYWFTGIALLALLGLTIGAAYLDLGPFNTIAAMAIALIKALLILLFFMHVLYDRPFLWVFVGAGFFWLGIMLVLGLSDYMSRSWR
jgi:cytochrome c oxidase subunit 4